MSMDRETHEHCYHPFNGPVSMVLEDGHVLLKCCKCPATKTEHQDHMAEELPVRPRTDRWSR